MLRKIFSRITGKPEQALKNEALRRAAIGGNLRRVKKLLAQGADVDYRDVNRLTPLYFAASHGFAPICRLLLEKGADPDVGAGDNPAIVQAAYFGYTDTLKTLVAFRADLNAVNFMNRTALHEAVSRNQGEAASILLAAGANPNTTDTIGTTPLSDAIGSGHIALACRLAEHGADGNAVNSRGETLRAKAQRKGQAGVVAALDLYAQEEAARRAAAQKAAEEKRERLAEAVEKAPVLQQDIKVKKPVALKPRP